MMLKINNNFKIGTSWGFTIFTIFGLFSYLTFIPNQTFAAYDWETRKLSDITTMQEMNAKICENSAEHETKQLEDTRDRTNNQVGTGKKYWVAKLADGKCWMTQNLDYDGGGTPITSIAGWTTGDGNAVTNTTAAYFDPGNYVYNGPSNDHGFASSTTCSNVTSVTDSKCNGYLAAINPSSTDTTTQELMHYHIGNYYSWNAAVNSTSVVDGSAITSGEASGSICPAGWRLPTSNGNDKEFAKLMLAYGWTTDNPSNIALTMNDNKGIYGAPLYLTYGGFLRSGQLHNVGFYGRYWSSTPFSNGTHAYYLTFDSGIIPSGNDYRYYGRSVRCVADPENYPDKPSLSTSDTSNLTVTVSPTISLDVTADAIMEDATFTKVSTSNIVANVSSNYQYTVSLSTNQSNLELATPVSGQNIPMIKDGENVVAGTNGWGIIKKVSAIDNTQLGSTVDTNTYSPVGENDEQIVFYKSAGPEALTDQTNPANPLTLKVGVGISPQLPQGTYSTTVTLTASTY